MENKAVVTNRLDHLDAERFREMIASPPFAIFRERIEKERDRQIDGCATADITKELRKHQGAAAALRVVLALPAQILKEIEAQKR